MILSVLNYKGSPHIEPAQLRDGEKLFFAGKFDVQSMDTDEQMLTICVTDLSHNNHIVRLVYNDDGLIDQAACALL